MEHWHGFFFFSPDFLSLSLFFPYFPFAFVTASIFIIIFPAEEFEEKKNEELNSHVGYIVFFWLHCFIIGTFVHYKQTSISFNLDREFITRAIKFLIFGQSFFFPPPPSPLCPLPISRNTQSKFISASTGIRLPGFCFFVVGSFFWRVAIDRSTA